MDRQDRQEERLGCTIFTNHQIAEMIGAAVDRSRHPLAQLEIDRIWPLLMEKLEIRNLLKQEEDVCKFYFMVGVLFGGIFLVASQNKSGAKTDE